MTKQEVRKSLISIHRPDIIGNFHDYKGSIKGYEFYFDAFKKTLTVSNSDIEETYKAENKVDVVNILHEL